MYKIIIKGTASTDFENPSLLDGIECDDEFSDYFDDEDFLEDKEVTEGFMSFKYEEGELWTYTEYKSKKKLTSEELEILAEYTQGQWSDGIGEGFEQHPCYYHKGEEVYISPWHSGQILLSEQTKI